MVAADEALEHAGWDGEPPYDPDRVGCVIGTGIGGLGSLEEQQGVLLGAGPEGGLAAAVPLLMGNAAAAAVAMRRGIHGQLLRRHVRLRRRRSRDRPGACG